MSYQPVNVPAKVRPSWVGYLIGAITIFVGIAVFVVVLVSGLKRISDEVDRFARFTVPKEGVVATVTLAKPGAYTLYFEYRSGAPEASQSVPSDLAVEVTSKSDGTVVPFSRGGNEASFSISGKRAGRSAGHFSVPAAGRYDIQVTGGTDRAPYDVAVGRGLLGKIGKTVLLAFGLGTLLGVIGVVLLIVTGVRRGRCKRRMATASAPGFGPGPETAAWPAGATWAPSGPPAPVVAAPLPPAPSGAYTGPLAAPPPPPPAPVPPAPVTPLPPPPALVAPPLASPVEPTAEPPAANPWGPPPAPPPT